MNAAGQFVFHHLVTAQIFFSWPSRGVTTRRSGATTVDGTNVGHTWRHLVQLICRGSLFFFFLFFFFEWFKDQSVDESTEDSNSFDKWLMVLVIWARMQHLNCVQPQMFVCLFVCFFWAERAVCSHPPEKKQKKPKTCMFLNDFWERDWQIN